MKLVVLLDKYLPQSETFITTQLISLSNQCELYLFYLDKKEVEPEGSHYFTSKKVITSDNAYYLKILGYLRRKNIYSIALNRINNSAFENLITPLKPNVILIHFGITAIEYASALKNINAAKFIYFHGYDASKLLQISMSYRYGIAELLKQGYLPIFVSKALLNSFKRYFSFSQAKVLYLGVDPVYFCPEPATPSSKIIFIQVSRFVEKKGHIHLINAIELFKNKYREINFELWLVGEGALKHEIERLTQEKNLISQVIFHGKKNREEIKNLLQQSTVYVQHSVTAGDKDMEGLPTSLLEAMSMELPIVSTYHSGIPELVENNINGFLSEEMDTASFCENLYKSIWLGRLPVNREKILKEFNTKIQSEKLIEYMNSIIA
jgi:glycosyltransferase involved in cell wall biosynthesis